MKSSDSGAIVKKMRPYVPQQIIPDGTPFFEAGGLTFHTHRCPEGDGHIWMCNSPYCEILNELCPDHDGPLPVVKGREPWRR